MAHFKFPMKKFMHIFMGCFLFFTFSLNAQNETAGLSQDQESFWRNVRFGGSLGLNFGNEGLWAPSRLLQFTISIKLFLPEWA